MRGMKTGIATAAVLLCLVVANDRGAEGRAQSHLDAHAGRLPAGAGPRGVGSPRSAP